MRAVQLGDGTPVVLGEVLARAGEGTIYTVVDRPDLVAKVFHPDHRDLESKRAKLTVMISRPPSGAAESDGFTVLTWPVDVLSEDSVIVGYVMPRVDTSNAVEIHTLSNPADRANPRPSAPQWTAHATWTHLVNVAANLCLAVDTVHRVDAVIGDFQERNILVNDTTRVTLVDCDSMQVQAADGRYFLCGVGRPEFTAPELAGVDLSVTPRDRPSDLFALAIHIHLLLMAGNHPFLRGSWTGGGDQPDAMTLARSGEWTGNPDSRLKPHPLAPPVEFLPPTIQRLFMRAFTDGARDPELRPSAAEWRSALLAIQVMDCPRGHQIPVEADPCPWCVMDQELTRRRAQHAQATPPQPSRQAVMPIRSPAAARPAPVPQPASTPAQSRTWMWVGIGLVAALLVGVAVFAVVSLSSLTDEPHSPGRYQASPSTTRTYSPSSAVATPPPTVRPVAVIVGTCDEGGSCGVKQRTGPYTAAPRLVQDDLYDGYRVTLVCQTVGDVRSNEGRGSSAIWYRLDNGAYVASVYMDSDYADVPAC